ncbi:MAG TPA: ABC transporter permease [Candidatus Saccharimonadales bacterium]|nr:ABC transporter permease [Candidatus Saccharimonadales bacterium]
MNPFIQGDIKMALNSLRSTRWRSLLTMLGVVIGVASVVTIVSIGEGIKQQVVEQINQLGKDLIIVRPGVINSNNALSIIGGTTNTGTLDQSDQQTIQAVPNVQYAVPLGVVPGVVQTGTQSFPDATVIGTNQNIPQVLNQTFQYGNSFDDSQSINTAVLGQNIANQLFPGEVPLGRTFTFHSQTFIVRGELNSFNSAPLSLDINFNNAIFIPYSVAKQLQNGTAPLYEVLVKPNNPKLTDSVVDAIKTKLAAARGGDHNFTVLKQNNSLAVSDTILNLLTNLISGIAAVSLLVGGIGIMNVMLVAVTERTSEIGVRKAIGATNRQILNQFLIEAVVLSFAGGILGVILSLLINVALRVFTNLQPLIPWPIMVLAVGVALVVGVIFGIIPAIKAARKDPIDALRYQ